MKKPKASPPSMADTLPALMPLAERLHFTALHLLVFLRQEDTKAGVTASRLAALSAIVFEGPISLGDVARIQQVKAPTMTRLVAALEKQGLVKRTNDPGDGRAIKLTATRRGRELMLAARQRRLDRLALAMAALPPEKIARLEDSFPLLNEIVRGLAIPVHSGA
jgi:DNA-binding MarR family transcriptional regulator